MRLRLRMDRLLLGFRGLGLLRGWPFQDPHEADAQVAAMAQILSATERAAEREIEVLDVGEAYAAWAATYDPTANLLIEAEEPAIRSFLEGIRPGKALDVACGTGRLSAVLRDHGDHVSAIDGSPAMLARVEASTAALVCADMSRIPFRDATFDVVVCGLSLTHMQDLGPPVAEIARVVRPGGHAVLSDVHPLAVVTGAHAFFEREDGSRAVTQNEVHWPSAYVEAFRGAGLVVERLAEPPFDFRFLEGMSDPDLRSAAEVGVVGLPFALVWLLRRPQE